MIKTEASAPFEWKGSMAAQLEGAETKKEKIGRLVEVLKNHFPVHGCITGSCWLPDFDPDAWGSTPDVDLFVYSEFDLIRAVTLAEERLHMKPGKGSSRTEEQEKWKLDRLYEVGLNKKLGITTYTFYESDVMLNITFKQEKANGYWVPLTNAADVLMSFDMSIVMQGYDIASRTMFDLRPVDVPAKTAVPNPLRKMDTMMWTVAKWVRQFDRVVKYYGRGYDTRPMAMAYVDMIDRCLEAGSLFDSEESMAAFEGFGNEFRQKREAIAEWLEEVS